MSSSFNIEDISQMHKLMAPALFNKTWDLLDKEQRSPEEQRLMLAAAFASWYHWKQIGGPTEDERGLWMIAKVLVTQHKHADALEYAQSCLDICLKHSIAGFDLAFAYEMIARVSMHLENNDNAKEYYEKAVEAGKNIKDTNDRDYFFSQLADLKVDQLV